MEYLTAALAWVAAHRGDIETWASIAALAAALIGGTWKLTSVVLRKFQERRLRIREGAGSFTRDQISAAVAGYVPPDCTQLDPAGEEDLRRLVAVREPLIEKLIDLLSNEHEGKHIILLADSGMGKTSFLINFYYLSQYRLRGPLFPAALVSLARSSSLEQIKAVRNKSETVLLLDAFDEDTQAIRDHRSRLAEIMAAAADFRRVVVSCRTQFFLSDEEIPRETGVLKIGPRTGGESQQYIFYKLYLAPFRDRQIREFLHRRIPFWHPIQRRRAFSIVDDIPELSVRPMLLSVVPDLLAAGKRVHELYELYEFMVGSWVQREQSWIDSNVLMQSSLELAWDLYVNRSVRGSERMPPEQLEALLSSHAPKVERWRLTGRSLLNRDAEGHFKFAHRSVLEYLFVRRFIEGDERCANQRWTDLMRELFLSWAVCAVRAGRTAELSRILGMDLRETGLYPLFPAPRASTTMSLAMLKAPSRRQGPLRTAGRIGPETRSVFASVVSSRGTVYVCDPARDTVCCLPFDPAEPDDIDHDRALYRLTDTQLKRQLENLVETEADGRGDWRAPTIEDFDSLFYVNVRTTVLLPGEVYWSADLGEDGSRLCVVAGTDEAYSADFTLVAVRKIEGRRGSGLSYRVLKPNRQRMEGSVVRAARALLVRTTIGDADDFRHGLPT